jgi:hypothetical protein
MAAMFQGIIDKRRAAGGAKEKDVLQVCVCVCALCVRERA